MSRLVLGILATVFFMLPLGVVVVSDWLGSGVGLYHAYGVWGIVIFVGFPIVVAIGGYFTDDYR